MKRNYKKYYSAQELKQLILTEHKLPRTTNQTGIHRTFIAKTRNPIIKMQPTNTNKSRIK